MEFSAQQIADFLQGEVVGNKEVTVNDVSKIEAGRPHTLTFLANPKYTPHIYTTEADVVLVNRDFTPEHPIAATLIKVDNAYGALASLLRLTESAKPKKQGIDPRAVVEASAALSENAYVGAMAYVGERVKSGKNVRIYPQVFIGDDVSIGDNVTIYAGAKIYEGCVIGNHCTIQAGAVIGADGFGFAPNERGEFEKIPQVGNVVLEDHVEVGANTCIDRATMGSTLIRRGVKLDNLIQIAHNVEVGSNTVMAAQCGIAGSTKIGESCMLGGQVGVVGHLTLADRTKYSAQSGVTKDVKTPDATMQGSPAISALQFNRAYAYFRKLPEMQEEINELKKKVSNF